MRPIFTIGSPLSSASSYTDLASATQPDGGGRPRDDHDRIVEVSSENVDSDGKDPVQSKSAEIFAQHRLFKTDYTHFHVVVFMLTFLCNLLVHAARKSLGNVKTVIAEEWTPSTKNATSRAKLPDNIWNSHNFFPNDDDPACKDFLGGLDTAFMVSYAIGLFFSGSFGDRFNLRYILCIGLLGNAITIFLFSCIGEWFKFYSYYWYVPLWIANGIFQSTAMPGLVAVMGNWFGKSHRGFIFGLWSTNASIGNIFGSVVEAAFIEYGYEFAMLILAVFLLSLCFIMFFGLVTSPVEIGLPGPIADKSNKPDQEEAGILVEETAQPTNYGATPVQIASPNESRITFIDAILLPGVLIYAIAFGGVKLVNYSFFYWLPFYLNRNYHWNASESSDLASWYDFGGIFGAIIGGFVSDKLRRSPVLAFMLTAAIPTLFFYKNLPACQFANAAYLGGIGFFIAGVHNIISAAIAADLGRQPKLKSSTSALATVTGILDGIASFGGAAGQLLVPIIQENYGWDAVFNLFVVTCIFTLICLMPIVYRELKDVTFCRLYCCCCSEITPTRSQTVLIGEEHGD